MTATPGAGTPSTTAPSTATILTQAIGGNNQTWTVPSSCFTARFDCWGEESSTGTFGGYQSGILQVTPSGTVYINFPQDGGAGGAANTIGGIYGASAGFAGGSSADVRLGSNDVTSRVIVAGGAGGQGGDGSTESGSTVPVGGAGSPGGSQTWIVAGNGANNNNGTAAGGGGAVGQTPGAAGSNSSVSTANAPLAGQIPPGGNSGGTGGNGSTNAGWPSGGGGGGGGGYQGGAGGGGGGGDAGSVTNSSGAGGGGAAGGTSFAASICTGVRSLANATCINGGQVVMVTPNPPSTVITSPATSSVVDMGAGFSVTYAYTSAAGTASGHYMLRRRVLSGTSYQWWTGSAWVNTETTVSQSVANGATGTITFTSGQWHNGAAWEITVGNLDTNLAVGGYSAPVIVKAQTAPTVSISVPATTQEAFLSWTVTPAANCTQIAWHAMVYTATVAATTGFVFGTYATSLGVPTVPVYDSGLQYGTANSWTALLAEGAPEMLQQSSSYVIGVQVQQTSGQTQVGTSATGFTYASFVTPASGLSAPTTIAVSPSSSNLPPSALITLTGVTGATVQIQRSIDGVTWTPIRNTFSVYTAPVYDPEICPNTPTAYRAAVRNTALTLQSAFTASPQVTCSPTLFYLSNPLIPGSSIPVSQQKGNFTESIGERQAVYNLLGNQYPVVLADTVQAAPLTLNFIFLTDADYQAFLALQQSQAVLLLQAATWPEQWYLRLGPSFTVDMALNAARFAGTPVRMVSGTAQVVAVP